MSTSTRDQTLFLFLQNADPQQIADALKQVGLGEILQPRKITVTGATSAAAQDITSANTFASMVASPVMPSGTTKLPPIRSVIALRVTAGAATAGARVVTDAGGTPGAPGANGPGIVTLSDDGKTLTFEAAVTGYVIEYIARATNDPTATTFAPKPTQ